MLVLAFYSWGVIIYQAICLIWLLHLLGDGSIS